MNHQGLADSFTKGEERMTGIALSRKKSASKKRVLVIDGDPIFRNTLHQLVESLGYLCTETGSVQAALGLMERTRFSIVIADNVMPEMNGLELLQTVKPRYPELDVLIITGFERDYSALEIIQAGAGDFLARPFDMNQLQARLYKMDKERALRKKLRLADEEMCGDQQKSGGLGASQPAEVDLKDNSNTCCLSCGHLVHSASSLCENCLVYPGRMTTSDGGDEAARGTFKELTYPHNERRKARRVRMRKTFLYDRFQATTQNISQGGVQLKTKTSLSVGTVIKMVFSLEGGMGWFSGSVVYRQPLSDGTSLVGLQFIEMSDHTSRLLARFLDPYLNREMSN